MQAGRERVLRRISRYAVVCMLNVTRIIYRLHESGVSMSNVLSELKEKAFQLSDAERAELALSLIESLDGPADSGVEEAWKLEVERRISQIERGEVVLVPGDEVFARLRRGLG